MLPKKKKKAAPPRVNRLDRAERELVASALNAREHAYAPYSRFRVGAALRASDGRIFTGCNVENASYGATVCAERNAVAAAVVAGCRTFSTVAVVTSTSPPSPPCGLCRQVLSEFEPGLKVLLVNSKGEVVRTRLDRLLPMNFSGSYL